MDDTPEVIRRQMEETRTQLSEKLGTLEQQVAETVQSTGTAVNATVGAVQETVETVTGAVQGVVESISHAFDLRRQVQEHPWLVMGGAITLGYVAARLLTTSEASPQALALSRDGASRGHGNGAATPAEASPSHATDMSPGLIPSSWRQIRDAALGAIVGVVQELASRAVPNIANLLADPQASGSLNRSDKTEAPRGPSSHLDSSESARRRTFANTASERSSNPFSKDT